MKIDFGKAVSNGFGYAFMKDQFLVYFAFMLVAMSTGGYLAYQVIRAFVSENVAIGMGYVLALIGFVIVWILVGVWFSLAYVRSYQTRNKKGSLKKAFYEVKGMFWRMLAVTIVIGIISSLVGSVPYIGWLFSLIVGWVFLFVAQFIVISKKMFGDVFSASWKNFRKYTWETIVVWIVNTLIAMGIVFLFVIPLLAYFFTAGFQYMAADDISGLFHAIMGQPVVLAATLVIGIVGITISGIFSIGMLTDVFMQMYKKK